MSLRLIRPPRHKPALQDLISFWHQQDAMHALTMPVPWLFLQIPRFKRVNGACAKTQQRYHHVSTVQVPVFQQAHSLEVGWCSYRVQGHIQHHGQPPDAGHYTMIRVIDQSWCYDDAKSPRQLTDADHSHLYRNMHIAGSAYPDLSLSAQRCD